MGENVKNEQQQHKSGAEGWKWNGFELWILDVTSQLMNRQTVTMIRFHVLFEIYSLPFDSLRKFRHNTHTHKIDGPLNCARRYFCSHSFSFWDLITINLLTKNAHFHQIITPNDKLFRFGSLSFNFSVKSNLTFNKLAFNVSKWFDRKFAFSLKSFRVGIRRIHRLTATIVL